MFHNFYYMHSGVCDRLKSVTMSHHAMRREMASQCFLVNKYFINSIFYSCIWVEEAVDQCSTRDNTVDPPRITANSSLIENVLNLFDCNLQTTRTILVTPKVILSFNSRIQIWDTEVELNSFSVYSILVVASQSWTHDFRVIVTKITYFYGISLIRNRTEC